MLTEPIKELGEFVVPVKLHRDVSVELKVTVVREGDDGAAPAAADAETGAETDSETDSE